jgi:catechol 2,3-dioxygenase-like lactoylglutathione lyase family enzyme
MIRMRPKFLALVVTVLTAGCTSAQSRNLSGIAHVAFRVSDLERSQKFFEDLGFEKAFEFNEGGKVSEVFIKVNDRQFIELYPRTQGSQPIGFMHICFEVSDIESLRKAYMSTGLNPPEARKFRAGNLLFVLHDPEGQLLEYTQYLPGSLHDADRGQHLGNGRISVHLLAASTPAEDLESQREFYSGRLGFGNTDSPTVLRLPGDSEDEVELKSANKGQAAQLTFSVENAKKAEETIQKRGLTLEVAGDRITVDDPDGNAIVFRATPKSGKD